MSCYALLAATERSMHLSSQTALRQELYEQPRMLYVVWNEPASKDLRRWSFLVTASEQAKYGMLYQIEKNNGAFGGPFLLQSKPGQVDGLAGRHKIGTIALRVEGVFTASSYGGLVLEQVNESNGRATSQDWVVWMVDCMERNQLIDPGSTEKVKSRVPR
ncbi:hypothetical protein BKA62DRAFT_341070 [Auriculariales sp. MPI-PUGE-AT-0066]|nr:hypothetical protein BKA62DRAFT_341070 [Auriculariales sp. MPI-PUGE-AT-0066]